MATQTLTIEYDDATGAITSFTGAPGFNQSPTSSLDIGNVIIHPGARPYVDAWYSDHKQAGDTPMKFLLRGIYEASLRHRAAKLLGSAAAVVGAGGEAYQDYAQQVEADLAAALAAMETILP